MIYSTPEALDPVYGNNPVSWKMFFRIRPGKMKMESTPGTHDTNSRRSAAAALASEAGADSAADTRAHHREVF
jgi:hypothetical protein